MSNIRNNFFYIFWWIILTLNLGTSIKDNDPLESDIHQSEPSLVSTKASIGNPISVLFTGSPFLDTEKSDDPTPSPTFKDRILVVDVSQDIEKCTAIGYYTDRDANLAFEHAVAVVLPNLVPSNIKVNVVEDAPDIFRRILKSSGITIDYTIRFDYKTSGYENMSIAYSTTTDLLTDSIDKGNFTIILQRMALRYNSTCLRYAIATDSRLRITSPLDRYPLMPPAVTPFPTLSRYHSGLSPKEQKIIEIADDAELSLVIMLLSSSIFFCACSIFVVKKRMDWVYRRGNTFDDDADAGLDTEMTSNNISNNNNNSRGVESPKGHNSDETVVWFNNHGDAAPSSNNI